MPVGPFGEILGTTECLKGVSEAVLKNYKTKVQAPKNPKVVKEGDGEARLTPSLFMFQMSMDTAQKLANTRDMHIPRKVQLLDMSETTHQKFSSIVIDEPLFQPFPSKVYFQKFEPFNTYEVPLILRNQDKVPRLVKVIQTDSPYFKIIAPLNCGDKVGPGLPTVYKIQFSPEDKRDYEHELICITEREKFVVPIQAIGARALLDFPDLVSFGNSAVKHPSTKNLLVRNIGIREAKYSLSTTKPFTVSPSNGTLPPNESMQVSVEFKPGHVGDFQEDLVLHYDTGEDVLVTLSGIAEDIDVRLDASSMRIDDTYVGMANQATVRLTNRTSVIAHFRWTRFATEVEEASHRGQALGGVEGEQNKETAKFLDECVLDPTLRDKMSILTRTFQNRRQIIKDDSLLFLDDVIKIEPCEGDVWPHSFVDISVVFRPERGESYARMAFCDVTGRESRLPLRVSGQGMGPRVQFSYDTLDMGNVFIGSSHVYEVLLANKGDIEAIYSLVRPSSAFGRCFEFTPPESLVEPGAHQVIQARFSCRRLGDFSEDFFFQIDGASEMVKVNFTGTVIGPTFHFDCTKLKFGTVSYGFLNTRQCKLINTSLVPMRFRLRVPGDGLGDRGGGTGGTTERATDKATSVREFEVTPSAGTLDPQSQIRVQVDFCSTTLKSYETSLVVDVEGVGEQVLSIPIQARCIVPAVTVTTPILDYARCFLRHPYCRMVSLQNDTDLPVRYELISQDTLSRDQHQMAMMVVTASNGTGSGRLVGNGTGSGDGGALSGVVGGELAPPIVYYTSEPRGVIQPLSTKNVPLNIEAQGVEELSTTAYFKVVGSEDQPMPVSVNCVGEGPVVHVSPLEIDYGQIPVLTDVTRILTLSNESPISAKFTAHMVRNKSAWTIEPRNGEIPPEEHFEVSLTAHVDDCVRFLDKLQINFLESQARVIPLQAYGFGTTIVSEPKLGPFLDLGSCFSSSPCTRVFTLTNKGRRLQQMVWSTEGFSLVKPRRDPLYNERDLKYKNVPAMPQFLEPVFKLTPSRLELRPCESAQVTLEGCVEEPREIKERLVCHGIIGRQGGKEVLMKVDLRADFISPLLKFSTEGLFFRVDKVMGGVLEPQIHDLMVTNISSLPLSVNLQLPYPFALVVGGAKMHLQGEDGKTDDNQKQDTNGDTPGRDTTSQSGAVTSGSVPAESAQGTAGDVPTAEEVTFEDSRVLSHKLVLDPQQNCTLRVEFDPRFKDDLHCRTAVESLVITYDEHPNVDNIPLRGEVYFPNLSFEKQTVDFGCILNDTEVTRYLNVTNNSPLEVRYHWMFLVGQEPAAVKTQRHLPASMYGVDSEESGGEEEEDVAAAADGLPLIAAAGGLTAREEEAFGSAVVEVELTGSPAATAPQYSSMDKLDTERSEAVAGAVPGSNTNQGETTSPPGGNGSGPAEGGPMADISQALQGGQGSVLGSTDQIGQPSQQGGQTGAELSGAVPGEEEQSQMGQRGAHGGSDETTLTDQRASDLGHPKSNNGLVERMLEGCVGGAAGLDAVDSRMGVPVVGDSGAFEDAQMPDGSSRPKTRMGSKPPPPVINATLRSLMEGDREDSPMGVEEIFDILPLYGVLKPGETEQITMTFYGHADIGSEARAMCEVEGGPTYEISLAGEASLVQYRFDATEIDYGMQMYDQTATAEITLHNTGRVGFDYHGINVPDVGDGSRLPMGVPILTPPAGHIEAGEQQVLTVRFFPGVPQTFDEVFHIQVAHFEPEKIHMVCEGTFPRIVLDLPRARSSAGSDPPCSGEEDKYQMFYEEATQTLAQKAVVKTESLVLGDGADGGDVVMTSMTTQDTKEMDLHSEVERLVVKEFALKKAAEERDRPMVQTTKAPMPPPPPPANSQNFSPKKANQLSRSQKRPKFKPLLPDYLLDFGYVIAGTVRTHVVRVTNTGHFPASFSVDHASLYECGFHIEIDRVRQLPGAPDFESMEFVVSFDPRGANLTVGQVETVCALTIVNGPVVNLRLRAHVTMPDMEVSTDVVDFGDVKCGQCQIVSIQLYNHKYVRCDWSTLPTERELKEAASQVDKHTPMHLRRKTKAERPKPKIFELMPPTGSLLPGQKVNVQVKFMPTDGKKYDQRITVRLAQSSQRLVLLARGKGLEPQLEFERSLVEFGPTLPHGQGAEQSIVVKNPGDFPIEFYNLEFDKQYLEEEKILRLMQGWDEYNTLLLPPREPSEKLPEELTKFYEEQLIKVEEAEKQAKAAAEAAAQQQSEVEGAQEKGEGGTEEGEDKVTVAVDGVNVIAPSPDPGQSVGQPTSSSSDKDDNEDKIREIAYSQGVGELDVTPVSESIARHLGVDLTPEGKAARNRRGVSIIVHGPPMSGKTETAVALAKRYSAAVISIDSAIMESISNSGSTSEAAVKARELCAEAARKMAEEKQRAQETEEERKAAGLSTEALVAHNQGQAGGSNAAGKQKAAGSVIAPPKDKHLKGGDTGTVGAAPVSHCDGSGGANSQSSQKPSSRPRLSEMASGRLAAKRAVTEWKRVTKEPTSSINSELSKKASCELAPMPDTLANRLLIVRITFQLVARRLCSLSSFILFHMSSS